MRQSLVLHTWLIGWLALAVAVGNVSPDPVAQDAPAGGLQVGVADPVLGADGTTQTEVEVMVLLPGGLVPSDGTVVRLTASEGAVALAARTSKGVARALYIAGSKPGPVTITAECGGMTGQTELLLWPGQGKGKPEVTLIDSFESVDDWVQWAPLAQWDWRSVPLEGDIGPFGGKLTYRFNEPGDTPGTIDLTKRQYLRGLPWAISLWVKDDGSGNLLEAILQDATGQEFIVPLGIMKYPMWHKVQAPVWRGGKHLGEGDDRKVHYPVSFKALRLSHMSGPPASALSGVLTIANLTVTTLAPSP